MGRKVELGIHTLNSHEIQIIKEIWSLEEADQTVTVGSVFNGLRGIRKDSHAEIRSVINGLVAKGLLSKDASGHAHVFWSLISRDEAIALIVENVRNVFGN